MFGFCNLDRVLLLLTNHLTPPKVADLRLNFFKCFDVSEDESGYENEEQENIYRFAFFVFYVLCLIYYMAQ